MASSTKTTSKTISKTASRKSVPVAPKRVAPTPKTAAIRGPVKAVASKAGPMGTSGASADPFLRFFHSQALRKKALVTLDALEQAVDPEAHSGDLADLVAELTESGMDYYYLRALQSAKVGFIVEQSARLGMSGAVKVITSVSRKFIGRMDAAQLVVVSGHIRALMV